MCTYIFKLERGRKPCISFVTKTTENRSNCLIFQHNLQFPLNQKENHVCILLQLSTCDRWLLSDHSQPGIG